VSTVGFLGTICFSSIILSTTVYAQFSNTPRISVTGQIRSRGDAGSSDFFVEIYDPRTNAMIEREPVSNGQFQLDRVPAGAFSVRLVTAPGASPILEEYHQFEAGDALVLDLPEPSDAKPISGVVSLRELQRPIPKKAIREAYQAQQLALNNNLPAAIAKLEKAIRIDPSYRDAHCNLGILYARAGRGPEALAELRKALDIGPPSAPIYANLALISAAMRLFPEAESSARKALELDPANGAAQRVLKRLPAAQ
jgi:tetratricopeptide (TPR) repeat protein